MDAETRRPLGAALLGALLLVIGLVIANIDSDATTLIGAILMLSGGLIALISLGQVAVQLMRS